MVVDVHVTDICNYIETKSMDTLGQGTHRGRHERKTGGGYEIGCFVRESISCTASDDVNRAQSYHIA